MRIGCDVVYIPRLKDAKESFVHGVLSEEERLLYEESPEKERFLAGRFAAKEAYLKALGTGLSGYRLTEISIVPGPLGRPLLKSPGPQAEISISHDGDYAFAVALIEKEEAV